MATETLPTKILVAEDQPAMRQLIARLLRDRGYDVVEVGDGAMLWEELHAALRDEDNPTEVELVISDIRMPNMSGLEALKLIHDEAADRPVILITAFGDSATIDEARRLGATRVFSKPFDLRELVAATVELVQPR